MLVDAGPALIALLAATFVLAGLVKGVTGMGLPTVAMGLLGALLSPPLAAALLIAPSLVTNIWQLLAGPRLGGLLRQLWPMLGASLIGTLLTAPLLTGSDTGLVTMGLGAALLLYAGVTLLAPPLQIPLRHAGWLSPLVGLVTGMIAGATGVFVIPAVPYLQAIGLQKEDLVQALGLSFTVSTLGLGLGLAAGPSWTAEQMLLSGLAILPALAGLWIGQRLRHRISPARFRRWFLVLLALLGAEMLLRGPG